MGFIVVCVIISVICIVLVVASVSSPSAQEILQKEEEKYGEIIKSWKYKDGYFEFKGKKIKAFDVKDYNPYKGKYAYLVCKNGEKYRLKMTSENSSWATHVRTFWLMESEMQNPNKSNTPLTREEMNEARNQLADALTSYNPNESKNKASVIGRAVVGGVVAGPAGAVVGALSAVDKNNENSKK